MSRLLTWERRDAASDLLVVTNLWPDADRPVYGIFIKRQVDSLIAAGVRCDVLYLRGADSPLAYPWAAAWFAAHSLSIRRRYRLIHAHAGETALAARCAIGTPVLVSYCGDDVLGNPAAEGGMTMSSRIRAFVIRQHARLAKATVTKSAEMDRALPSAVRRTNRVIPNGVDVELFKPASMEAARRELGWDPDEHVALFGATRPWIPRKRAWLAEAACEEAARRLGRSVRLEIVANVAPERMPTLMNAANCLLMTSSIEGSPNIVKEALMCNLPVIATPAGDVAELLEGVSGSWLCEPEPEPLAQRLVECLSGGVRSDGREVAARLADSAIAKQLIDLYGELADIEVAPERNARPEPALTV